MILQDEVYLQFQSEAEYREDGPLVHSLLPLVLLVPDVVNERQVLRRAAPPDNEIVAHIGTMEDTW